MEGREEGRKEGRKEGGRREREGLEKAGSVGDEGEGSVVPQRS